MIPERFTSDPDPILLMQTWQEVWHRITLVVDDIRDALAPHLGAPPIDVRRRDEDALHRELLIGRSRIRFEPEPDRQDSSLLDVRILRVFPGVAPFPESTLSIDTRCHCWWSSEPALGPARIRDQDALEKLVFGLLVDRPPPQTSSAGIMPTWTRCGEAGRSRRVAQRGQETVRSSSAGT